MTLIWFLEKSAQHRLSGEAASLWVDVYSYIQQNDGIPLVPLAALQKGIHYDMDLFWRVCLELQKAQMAEIVLQNEILYCRLPAVQWYAGDWRQAI